MNVAVVKRFAAALLFGTCLLGEAAHAQVQPGPYVLRMPAAAVASTDQQGVLVYSGNRLDFSGVPVGTMGMKSLTVRNVGSSRAWLTSVRSSDDITFFGDSDCPGGIEGSESSGIDPGVECLVWAVFRPQSEGSASSVISYADSSGGVHRVTVTGTASGSPMLNVSADSMTLTQTDYEVPAVQSLVLRNAGSSHFAVSAAIRSASTDFSISPAGCSLAPGAECTVSVSYAGRTGFSEQNILFLNYGPDFSIASVVHLKGVSAPQ